MRKERARHPAALAVLVGALVLAAVLVVGTPAAVGAKTATLANSVAFQDSTGEDPLSLDIGSVTVSNDDSALVAFDVKFVNGSLSNTSDWFYVVLNTDRDESTGDPEAGGAEYFIGWHGSSALLKWNGSDFDLAPMQTLVMSVQPGGIVAKVNTSELGGTKSFDFYVKTYRPNPGDPFDELSDWAPDFGLWTYDVKLYVPPVLTAGEVTCIPDPPKAGRAMVARMPVTVTRGGVPEALATTATVKATAKIAGKRITGTVMPTKNGNVSVKWLVPKTAKGKLMRGTISVTLEKVTVTKSFSDRIK